MAEHTGVCWTCWRCGGPTDSAHAGETICFQCWWAWSQRVAAITRLQAEADKQRGER